MKTENFLTYGSPLSNLNSLRSHSRLQHQPEHNIDNKKSGISDFSDTTKYLNLSSLKAQQRNASGFSDKESVYSGYSGVRSKRNRSRNIPMKSTGGITKKNKTMEYTNYAYNEAVGRLKLMLVESYAPKPKAYLRSYNNDDSTDNLSDNLSVIDRPVFSDISKYLSPSQKSRLTSARPRKPIYSTFSASKENLAVPVSYQSTPVATTTHHSPLDYMVAAKPQLPLASDSVQAPVEIFSFIEKQEDYIEQLEKESKYCRNELTNLLGKVKDVINENEQLTEHARSELGSGAKKGGVITTTSLSSDSDDNIYGSKKVSTPRKKDAGSSSAIKSPRYANAPNIVYEARISELEAELMQANIDLKRVKAENEELKRKLARTDPLMAVTGGSSAISCDTHRKQIEHLQTDKLALEETICHLQKTLDDAKSQQYSNASKRYINDLVQMERSQAELEVKHLRDELDRQHERVRELQHEMARRLADERSNAERRYNTQVDQLGGDLSNQWEQVAKLQLDVERQKRYETDMKRDLANRNAQIDELKMELRSNRSTFLADMAQVNAEKQSLEQEITALRLQLDRSAREGKTEAARLNAEINSLRQRLDRGDADLLHSKREVLRLNDEIANLEKELAYGELKNEIRPTKKDLDKRMTEMQDKHAETVNELEDMIQSQKQLMDKLTNECKMLTNKLEDTTLKHNQEKQHLRVLNEKLMQRLKQIWASYKELNDKPLAMEYSDRVESEEHFSPQRANNLMKPLSTTSRPHLAQPTTHDPPTMTILNPNLTATSQYLAEPQQAIPLPQQQAQLQLPFPQRMTSTPNQAMSPQATPAQAMATRSLSTAMDSTMTTTMKISKIILAKEKSNKNVNRLQQEMEVTPISQRLMTTTKTATKTIPAPNHRQSIRTWPPPAPLTTIPIIQAMKATTSPNTTQVHMEPMISSSTSNMMPLDRVMTQAVLDRADMRTTQPLTMISPPINMTQRHCQQQTQQQRQQQQQQSVENQQTQQTSISNHHHLQQHHQHHKHISHQQHRYQLPRLQMDQSLDVQQQTAAHNLARAEAMWGQQLNLENPENPICNNSLPWPQPKSSYEAPELNLHDLFDPFELEFSISSPSLIRSCYSSDDTCTEIDNADVMESIGSDMSISPAHTAIRRITPTADKDAGCNVNLLDIQCEKDIETNCSRKSNSI